MQTATLKKATEILGISSEDIVSYQKHGDKAIIEIELKPTQPEPTENSEPDIFEKILAISEDIGVKDWARNHDHYLYGTPKRKRKKSDA